MTDKQILTLIGRNLQKARHDQKLTQEALAEMVDVHWKTLGYIEAGRRACSSIILARLTQCLSLSAERLFKGIQEAESKRIKLISKAQARKRKPQKRHKPK